MTSRKIFWGILFILLAILIIASQTQAFDKIGVLTYVTSALLLVLMINSAIKGNFFGVFIPIAFLYTLFDAPLGWTDISIWILLIVAILASIGFTILFKRKSSKVSVRLNERDRKKVDNDNSDKEENKFDKEVETDEADMVNSNNPNIKVTFNASSKRLQGNSICKGKFVSNFGYLEVFFDRAKLNPNGAEITVECNFGAMKLFIPKGWRVKDNIEIVLGSVEKDDSDFKTKDENPPELNLNGKVQFGGVEIEYI